MRPRGRVRWVVLQKCCADTRKVVHYGYLQLVFRPMAKMVNKRSKVHSKLIKTALKRVVKRPTRLQGRAPSGRSPSFWCWQASSCRALQCVSSFTLPCDGLQVTTSDSSRCCGTMLTLPASGNSAAAREWSAVFGFTITNLSTRIHSAGAVEPLKFDQLAGHSWKGSTLAPAAFVRSVWHYQRQEMHVNKIPRLLAAGEIGSAGHTRRSCPHEHV